MQMHIGWPEYWWHGSAAMAAAAHMADMRCNTATIMTHKHSNQSLHLLQW